MTDDLHSTMDAVVWAKEFCKRWPSALCQIEGKEGVQTGADFEDTMIGWFANAIMVGYDTANNRAADRIEALTKERDEAMQLLQTLSNMNGDLSRDMYKTKLLLAKAVEALQAFKDFDDMPTSHKRPDVFEVSVRRKLLSTLAEIEGEKE